MSLRRASALFATALRSDVGATFASGGAVGRGQALLPRGPANFAPSRGMAGGGNTGEPVTHAGLTIRKPDWKYSVVGEALAGLMWFWIFVRAYHDGDVFLYGHAIHFEHDHDDEHEEH